MIDVYKRQGEKAGNRRKEELWQVHRWVLELCGKQETIRIPFRSEQLPGQLEPRLQLETEEHGLASVSYTHLDGELCDFKDGEANSLRIWLEMKESGENLLGYMVKSGIEGLEKKNGIGENEISQGTL